MTSAALIWSSPRRRRDGLWHTKIRSVQWVVRRPEPGYRLIWLAAITPPPNFQTQYSDPAKHYLLKRLPDFHDLMHSEANLRMAAILLETPLNSRGFSLLAGASLAGAAWF